MAEERKDAFFLDPDEAISLGNVEYMRKAVKTKRTFPKAKGGGELVQEVSATAAREVEDAPKIVAPTSFSVGTPKSSQSIIPDPVVITPQAPKTGVLEQVKTFSSQGIAPAFPKVQFTSKEDRQKNDSNLTKFRKMDLSNETKQSSERQRNDSNLDKFRKMARRSAR
jgi:hypothetical protein